MRRSLPYLLALVLGAGAAVLAACGDKAKAGISAERASALKSDIEDVQQRVDDGRCQPLFTQLRQVDDRVDRLPSSVDAQLRGRLREGADKLRDVAKDDCEDNRQAKETETTTTETPTTPETTETQPPPTTTKPPSTATEPEPEPEPEPVPEPVPDPGGGTPPEIGP